MSRPVTFTYLTSDDFDREPKRKLGRKGPRHRDPVSCWPCRTRKTRCDRLLPCSPCSGRGAPSECAYESSNATRNTLSASPTTARNPLLNSNQKSSSSTGIGALQLAIRPNYGTPNTPPGTDESTSTSPAQTRSSTPTRSINTFTFLHQVESNGIACLPKTQNGTKQRMVGITHWMAPCSEMLVVSAMLSGSHGFQENRQAFRELKGLVREANEILPRMMPGFSTKGCPRTLLPDRLSCDAWITQYFQSWGRIYAFMDSAVLVNDLDQIFPLGLEGIADDSLPLLRIFLVVAIGMQDSETDRLLGRRLARYVEHCIHSSKQFRKPCIEVLQLLLLLTIMKTISASDTDGLSNVLGIQSLTSQIVLVMGLHRDPAIFPNLSLYETEMRKRLWGCFLRLGLDYGTRSGTQFILFVDDLDCPLPSSTGLRAFRQLPTAPVPEQWENDGQSELDAKFNCFTAELAKTVMVFQQPLCSNVPSRLIGLQADVRRAFDEFLVDLPFEFRPGTPTTCAVQRLQQTLISTTLHSLGLITGMCNMIGKPYDVSLQGQWTETWDHSISILDQFQNLCQHNGDNTSKKIQTMAHQLLWADVARAALCACLAVGNMHRRSLANLISPTAQQTAGIFEKALNRSLTFLMQFWKHRFYLGPVISKLALLLAVAMTVTANLREVPQSKDDSKDDILRKIGITVAEEWVNGMRAAMTQQGQSQALINETNADAIGTSVGSTPSRTTGSPAIITPKNEDNMPREICTLPEDITTAAGTVMDDGQLLYDMPPAIMQCLESGETIDMVDFGTADPKLTSEFSQLEDIDFNSASVQESIMEILNELEMAPMDSEFVFGFQS